MDIFEYLRSMLGCQCISDLRFEPYKIRAQRLLQTIPLQGYSLEVLSDLAEYLYDGENRFETMPQAIAFLQRSVDINE